MKLTDSTERLAVMTLEYDIERDGNWLAEPVIQLFCRDASGARRTVEIEGFYPFFYVRESEISANEDELFSESMIRSIETREDVVSLDNKHNDAFKPQDEPPRETLHEEPLAKITTVVPTNVSDLRDYFDETWEADVFFTNRFLIESGITRGVEVPADSSRVHFDDISSCEPPSIQPRLLCVDIEVYTGGSFPSPEQAAMPVTAVSAYDTYSEEYIVYGLHPSAVEEDLSGIRNHEWPPYEEMVEQEGQLWPVPDGVSPENVEMEVFDREDYMLGAFNQWVGEKDPDLLTGWNSSRNDKGSGFDYPYIINRCENIGETTHTELSNTETCFVSKRGSPVIGGREMFDMLQAYKKTQIHEKESYSLESISQEELGYGKEDVEGGLDYGWIHEPDDFMRYNIRDVEAVIEIEKVKGVLDMYDHIRSIAGATYTECADSNIGIIDILYLRRAKDQGLALPTSTKPDRGWYYGAVVIEPTPGKHENVVYPDLASLYPYLMWSLNVSPETLYESVDAARDDGYSEDQLYSAYIDYRDDSEKKDSEPQPEEIYYLKPDVKEGFVRSVITELTEMKYEYKGDEYPDEAYDAVKRIVNSVYGVFGDSSSYGKGFRLFDWRLAETITISGRKVLEYTADEYTSYLQQYGHADAELIGGDSVPANEPILVDRGDGVEIIAIEDASDGDMVWSQNGWTSINNVIRKPNQKQLYTVATKSGITHVTEDHSLVRDTMEEVSPENVTAGDTLLHNDVAGVDVNELSFDERRAWLLGLFAAEGSCGIYDCESGSKASWAINNSERSVLEEAQEIMEDVFGVGTKIDDVMESSGTMKLRLHRNTDNASTVLGFRELLYNGSEKRVPKEILQADADSKKAFLAGYHTGDGHIAHDSKQFDEMWTKHKHLASGIVFLLRQVGHNVTLSVRTEQNSEYYRIRSVQFHRGGNKDVRTIEEHTYSGEYVYDLETDSQHFQSGIGSMIVHNTDSCMTTLPSLDVSAEEIQEDYERMEAGKSPQLPLFKAAEHVNNSYDDFMSAEFGIDDPSMHKMEVEVESYAESLFFQADFKGGNREKGTKKRYAQLITWDEGEVIEDPDVATKGFELVRSDSSKLTKRVQEGVLERILRENAPEECVSSFLKDEWDAALGGDVSLEDIGKPSAVNKDLWDYGWTIDDDTGEVKYYTPQPSTRGARYADEYIDGENLKQGSKPLAFYLDGIDATSDLPETYDYDHQSLNAPSDEKPQNFRRMKELGQEVDAIALDDPSNMPSAARLDYEKMAEKSIRGPVEPITWTMGWDFDELVADGMQRGLSEFM